MQYLVAENGSLNLLRFVSIYSALGRGFEKGGSVGGESVTSRFKLSQFSVA